MEDNTSKAYLGAAAPMQPVAGASGTGSALFVINLCASIAPVQVAGKNLPGLENYRLYQVARVEDGRTRHRLRLGFFASESHAESVLTIVRQQYPTAFTTCLCDEDRRFARGYLPEAAAPVPKPSIAAVRPVPAPVPPQRPAAAVQAPGGRPAAAGAASAKQPAAAPVTKAAVNASRSTAPLSAHVSAGSTSDTAKHPTLAPVRRAQPAAKAAPASQGHAKNAAAGSASGDNSTRVPALTLSEPAPVTPDTKARPASQPFHVGRGVDIPDAGIRLQSDTPHTAAAAPESQARSARGGTSSPSHAKSSSPVRAAPASKPTPATKQNSVLSQPKMAAAAAATRAVVTPIAAAPARPLAAQPVRAASHPLPELDSTQTIRALTSAELSDDTQEKWFAIQLAASEQPVNLDAMPHLDIFEAYRLYSVATAGSGKIIHSLRLGFFREAVSAEAVSGYLKTFFGSPTVLRVSAAEHARFKEPLSRESSAAPAASRQEAKVVELSDARAARPVVPTVTMEVAAPRRIDPAATGSFKPNATGSFNVSASGSHRTLTPALKPAAKSAGAVRRGAAATHGKGGAGKRKPMQQKSLSQQLLDEAREVELSASGIRKLPKNDSLLSRLVGKLTK